ncbi:TPA: hypothetical protein EYP66_24160 [Candidatus Poribacteria bacterium]|nr:hypothetical protein [Candidatus Poribacteria bacterium]
MSINKIHRGYFTLALLILVGWLIQSAQADYWSVSYYDYDYDYSRSDRISREHRDAGDVDDWIERGNSTVTTSPHFRDGIRLSAWASDYISDDEYDFALASAIYLFDIPRRAQYIKIKVRYRGEGREADFDDYEEIAGRVWIRNFRREREGRRYDYDDKETLYGDTFVLRAKRRSETIKIPAAHHVGEDDVMELHVVVENGGLLDVEYVDVATYRYLPEVRVVNRYIRTYEWRPWYNYTYFYFYDGPVYYVTDYDYYVRWSYPVYDVHYVTIRKNYRAYLHRYYKIYPSRHHGYSRADININVYDRQRRGIQTPRLSKWTPEYERVRREYDRSRLMKRRRRTDIERVRNSVRVTIENHRRQPVLSDRLIQKRRRSSAATSERSSVIQDRGTPRVRIVRPTERQNENIERIIRNRSSRSSTTKSGTSSSVRSDIKKRRSSSSISSSPSRSSVKSNRSDSSRRESVTKRRSSSSSSQSSSSKKDDDDDEEKKRKQQQSRESTKKRRR